MTKKVIQKLETEITLAYEENGLTVDVSNILNGEKASGYVNSVEINFSYEDVLNQTLEYLACGKNEDGSVKLPDRSKEELKKLLVSLDKLKEKIESYL